MASSRRRLPFGTGPWLVLAAAAILAVGSTPSIAGQVPPWLVPAVALAGAALIVRAFVRSLVPVVRGDRTRIVGLLVNLVLLVFFVALPATRLFALIGPARPGAPRIVARFDDWRLAEGYPRLFGHHTGVDLAGRVGTPVLAAADGRIVVAGDTAPTAGSWSSSITRRTDTGRSTVTSRRST